MGCAHSKLPRAADDASSSRAVALCRHRSALLEDAIARRYDLANAHRAYAASLAATGAALHDFLRAVQDAAPAHAPPPPGPGPASSAAALLLLPAQRKGDADGAAAAAAVVPALPDAKRADGDDGAGHVRFDSDSDSDSEDTDSDDGGGHIRFPSDDDGPDEPPPLLRRKPLQPAAPPSPPPQMMPEQYVPHHYLPTPPSPPQQMLPPYVSAYPPPVPPTPPEMAAAYPPMPPEPYVPVYTPMVHTPPEMAEPYAPAYTPMAHTPPEMPAPYAPPYIPMEHTPPEMPAPYVPPYIPMEHTPPEMPAPYVPPYIPMEHTPPEMAAPYGPAFTPMAHTPPEMPAPYAPAYPPPPYSYGHVAAPGYGYGADMGGGYGQSFYTMSYARSQPPPPSVSYEHRPEVTNATVRYYQDDDDGTGSPFPGSYYGGYPYQYPQSGGGGGGFDFSYASASSSHQAAPLPPPSPPRVSTWDFLDPFEAFETFHQDHPDAPAVTHAPSHSSNGIGEDEDMPELEDEELAEAEEAHGAEEFTAVNGKVANEEGKGSNAAANEEGKSSNATANEEGRSSSAGEQLHRASKSSECSSITVSEELCKKSNKSWDDSSSSGNSTVHVTEKSVVEEQLNHPGIAGPPAVPEKVYNDDVEVVQEIKVQFDRASSSAGDVSRMLEVGKMPYYQKKNSGLKVSSIIRRGLPSKGQLQFEEEKTMQCGNITSTLQKLDMLEKKLLQEVKAEEKIRVRYDQKRMELKKLYNKGAEAYKLEAVENGIRKLLPNINVGLRIVNTTSKKINKLRDEELWPQIHELIQGFMQMWHSMSECHEIQSRAMSQAKKIDSAIAAARFSEEHIDLVKQLELQLLDMTSSFAAWFNAQKICAATLNEWLKRGIEYEPEVTDDGVAPFSPGRLGAPPIFIICNNWATSLGRISETEVVDAMRGFASNVLRLWERHRSELRQGLLASRGTDKDLRSMERDGVSMRRALEAQNKKLVLVSNQSGVSLFAQGPHDDDAPPAEICLQSCMSRVFEALESFAAACATAYKDLHLRSEEEKAQPVQDQGAGVP